MTQPAMATTPDLISMLDAESGDPFATEGLRYGFRAAVVAMPCNLCWRREAGLCLVGPGYFGYDIPYVPTDERVTA